MNKSGISHTPVGLDQPNVERDPAADAPAAVPSGSPGHTMVTDGDRRFVTDVVATYGPTVRRTASGRTELNLASMSRILARRLGLAWDGSTREFLLWRDQYVSIPTERANSLVDDALQRIAALQPDNFPMRELRPRRIARMMDAIRMTATRVPDAQDGLIRFAHEGLCVKSGNSITIEEIYGAYWKFAATHRLPVYGRLQFNRKLKQVILKTYAKRPSNSLLRPVGELKRLTSRRGYREMAFTDIGSGLGTAGTA